MATLEEMWEILRRGRSVSGEMPEAEERMRSGMSYADSRVRQMMDILQGAGEIPLSLGSSLVAYPVGAFAGLGEMLARRAFGEGQETAGPAGMERFRQGVSALTFQPRSASGQEGLELLGKGFEASKLPPLPIGPGVPGALRSGFTAPGTGVIMAAERPVTQVLEPGGVPLGAKQIFAGVKAKTADLVKLEQAKTMRAAGATPDEILKATGWWQGADQHWRFEIPDYTAKIVPEKIRPTTTGRQTITKEMLTPLGEAYQHPALYAAYPKTQDIGSYFSIGPGVEREGLTSWRSGKPLIAATANNPVGLKRVVSHEIEHAIENLEGWSPGGSASYFASRPGSMFGEQFEGLKPFELYRSLAGEAEARLAGTRSTMPPRTLKKTPPYIEDIPREKQLVLPARAPHLWWDEPLQFGQPVPRPPYRGREPLPPAPPPDYGPPPVQGTLEFARNQGGAPKLDLTPEILGRFPTTTAGRIINKTKEGGYTVQPQTGEVPTSGYMVGRWPNEDPRILVTTKPSAALLKAWAEKNRKLWADPESFIGGWKQDSTGKYYFEAPTRYPETPEMLRPATKFGERKKQITLHAIKAKKDLPIGNWKEFVTGPEFKQRMAEMEAEGEPLLPRWKNWSQLEGTIFETIYGKENLPKIAGLTGVTSPNLSPRQNLQVMSEYGRRLVAGEPLNQPLWRTPEGLMTFAPGKKLPLAQTPGRPEAIETAGRGDLAALGDVKVGNMARAPYDPNAVILDRRWAWLAEDPKRGIFTAAEPNIIEDVQYPLMKNIVTQDALIRGDNPRDYSARIWVGIGEFIKKHGHIYGEKRGPGRVGSNEALAIETMRLIEDKARFLNITPEKVIQEMRRGKMNLMSWFLATPAGLAVYEAVRDELDQKKGD